MRSDTYSTSAHLVALLQMSQVVDEVLQDDGDIILITLRGGEHVAIHLIERQPSLYEWMHLLKDNARMGFHTLFLLWGNMFVPEDGFTFEPDEWMQAMLAFHGGKVYAYDAFGPQILIFPVYFEKDGYVKLRARYGDHIGIPNLKCDTVKTHSSHLRGTFRVAEFTHEAFHFPGEDEPTEDKSIRTKMQFFYAILGVTQGIDRETLKVAYRRLAMQHHPDLSDDLDATERMQMINEAYTQILKHLDEVDVEDV